MRNSAEGAGEPGRREVAQQAGLESGLAEVIDHGLSEGARVSQCSRRLRAIEHVRGVAACCLDLPNELVQQPRLSDAGFALEKYELSVSSDRRL